MTYYIEVFKISNNINKVLCGKVCNLLHNDVLMQNIASWEFVMLSCSQNPQNPINSEISIEAFLT